MRQSFAWWALGYGRELDAPAFLDAVANIGIEGVEMLPEALWPLAVDAGLAVPTIIGDYGWTRGFNDRALHEELSDRVRSGLDAAERAGATGLIVFSGLRGRHSAAEAADVTAEGLAPLAAEAAHRGLVLLLELLNSTVDHVGYQCDRTSWGVDVVRQVNSPGLRLLYDAYHMQVMEGDLMRTLAENAAWIGHIHTAGVPGRRDLDDTQEVNWRAIANQLRRTGYAGWIGHEFIPRGDPIAALRHAVALFEPT